MSQIHKPQVYILIVCYFSDDDIRRLLTTISGQSVFDIKILIFMNDGRNLINAKIPDNLDVTLITSPVNIGFAAANNVLIQRCIDADHIVICNPDIMFSPSTLPELLDLSSSYNDPLAITPVLLRQHSESGQDVIDSLGISSTWYGRFFDIGANEIFNENTIAKHQHKKVIALCGALIIFNRSAIDHLRKIKFDERFFLYKEDIDLGIRLRRAGVKLFVHLEVFARHGRRWKRRNDVTIETKLFSMNGDWILFLKHWDIKKLIPHLSFLLAKQIYILVEFFHSKLIFSRSVKKK